MDGSATLPNVTSVRFILVWVLILVRRARASGCIARIVVGRRATRALPPTTTRRRRFMVPDEAVSAPQATPFPSACDKQNCCLITTLFQLQFEELPPLPRLPGPRARARVLVASGP